MGFIATCPLLLPLYSFINLIIGFGTGAFVGDVSIVRFEFWTGEFGLVLTNDRFEVG